MHKLYLYCKVCGHEFEVMSKVIVDCPNCGAEAVCGDVDINPDKKNEPDFYNFD